MKMNLYHDHGLNQDIKKAILMRIYYPKPMKIGLLQKIEVIMREQMIEALVDNDFNSIMNGDALELLNSYLEFGHRGRSHRAGLCGFHRYATVFRHRGADGLHAGGSIE